MRSIIFDQLVSGASLRPFVLIVWTAFGLWSLSLLSSLLFSHLLFVLLFISVPNTGGKQQDTDIWRTSQTEWSQLYCRLLFNPFNLFFSHAANKGVQPYEKKIWCLTYENTWCWCFCFHWLLDTHWQVLSLDKHAELQWYCV